MLRSLLFAIRSPALVSIDSRRAVWPDSSAQHSALNVQHSALILCHYEQIALEVQDMLCAYLAHDEQESTCCDP